MGNNASNEKGSPRNNDSEFEQVEKDPTAAAAAAAAAGRSSPVMNDMSKSTVLVDKPSRRIVKASAPTTTGGTLTGSGSTESLGGDKTKTKAGGSGSGDEGDGVDDSNHGIEHGHQIGIQSDEELLQDSIDQNRKARMQQLQQKQKSDRQHQLDERRKGKKPSSKVQVQANPFSRFLSAFSVEPEFPQHKRKDFQDEDSDLLPAKKVRTESDADDDDVNKKPSPSSLLKDYLDYYVLDPISQSNIDWKTAATATAVVVASIIVVGHYSNRKKF